MTRQYWSGHEVCDGLITDNLHVAMLIIRSFEASELPMERYHPYLMWKKWLREQKGQQ